MNLHATVVGALALALCITQNGEAQPAVEPPGETRQLDSASADPAALPGLEAVVDSKIDLWGEAALRQPNGASYEFFEPLLPPPRYVHADFRHYPIVLSAPRAKVKARLISNGSGVNVRGGSRSWREIGTPFIFRVGPDETRFGEFLQRVEHPTLAAGYLPVPEVRYRHDERVYRLEAFASVDPDFAEHALVLVKFDLASGTNGQIAVQVDAPVTVGGGMIRNEQGEIIGWYGANWQWQRQRLIAKIGEKKPALLAIATQPFESGVASPLANGGYNRQRAGAVQVWNEILAAGMRVEVPEARVNNAWRHLILQNFSLLNGDRLHYSAGNQYDALYEAEGSDAALAMLQWGYEAEMRRMIVPLLDFTRKGLEYHQAGHKLDDVARYYWQTRDADFVHALRPRWQREVDRILNGRTNEHGLFPKEQYCGDIPTPVYSLNSNAKCWAALRDFSAALHEMGESELAPKLKSAADTFHVKIMAALAQSIRRESDPPFMPIALHYDEGLHDPITGTRIGSYWNLMANYIIGARLFPPGSAEEKWLPAYLEQKGGLCMGMTRSGGRIVTFWPGLHRTNPLYGLRYVIDTLRRDDPERALVSFYGMLAHGFTRNTFVGAEACALMPTDEGGRLFYCPPNSASNGHFLWMLRHLLVQDFDLNNDGKPETLRLAFATPKRWLADGQTITVERAPTAFGPVSMTLTSRLKEGEVMAALQLPERNLPERTLLRVRVPEGWEVTAAAAGRKELRVDREGTVDLTELPGPKGITTIRFRVRKL